MPPQRLICLLLATILLGCGSAPRTERSPQRALRGSSPLHPALSEALDRLFPDSLFPPSNAGVKIYSLDRNETLYELNPDMLFWPASNQKLMTSAAALRILGGDYTFKTTVSIDTASPPRIIVHGSGDPTLTTVDLDSIAEAIANLADHDREWTLTGDVSLFDTVSWGRGWMWDDEPGGFAMFITPLSVEGNSLELVVLPGKTIGEPGTAFTVPFTEYANVQSSVRTIRQDGKDSLVITRTRDSAVNTIFVRGDIPAGRTHTEKVSLWKPERYFLETLAARLGARGIRIAGEELRTEGNPGERSVLFNTPIQVVIQKMSKESDNLSAENLFRTLGAETSAGPGSTESGERALKRFLGDLGVDTARTVIADGSGVSRYNLVSASELVEVLRYVRSAREIFPVIYESLPVAGLDGTLSSRMKNTPAQGNLRAKTGTFTGSSALSGFVTSADGELIAFSILMQNYASKAKPYREVQDSIGVFLSRFRRSDW